MVNTKRRTEIIIEKRRVTVLSTHSGATVGRCGECGGQVRMVTAEVAAVLVGVSTRTIYRRLEAGEVHYTEVPDGLLLICANSLGAA